MVKENKWVAWIAVLALVVAVVALAFVIKNGMTGNAIFITPGKVCKTFEVGDVNNPIDHCASLGYPKCINGYVLGGNSNNIITVPLSCEEDNPYQMLQGAWNDIYENEPITKTETLVTCCKK